jgi:hypothetical protein
MNTFPSSIEFSRHSENLAAILAALTQVERAHKRAIKEGDSPSELAMRRIHALLLGVYAEAALRKIVTDPTGFNQRERLLIWASRSQVDRWLEAVDLAARRHFGVFVHQSLDEVLQTRDLRRIDDVNGLLGSDLEPVITDRNRLAHGQWVWQLVSGNESKFAAHSTTYDYNYSALRARFKLLESIGRLVNVLCVSEPTFDRDFALLIARISAAKQELDGSRYPALVAQLRRRHVASHPITP